MKITTNIKATGQVSGHQRDINGTHINNIKKSNKEKVYKRDIERSITYRDPVHYSEQETADILGEAHRTFMEAMAK